ncbi:MAG TPA: hypothetical protein P5075_05175 [Eubacteriales bacterium]|nr:hypothetical protein [Eubacteriales bacterium]
MSRAFTSERDGWAFCKQKMQECMFAEENGTCMFRQCRKEAAPDTAANGTSGGSGAVPRRPADGER